MTKAKTLADTVSTGGPLATPGAVNLPGGAQGSVPYQSAAGVTALLAPGTAGHVLTSGGSGAAPTWSTPSAGAMTLISTTTASNVATVDIEGLTSTYDVYVLIGVNLTTPSDQNIAVRMKYNGAYLTTGYSSQGIYNSGNSVSAASSGSTEFPELTFLEGGATTRGNFEMQIFNPASVSTTNILMTRSNLGVTTYSFGQRIGIARNTSSTALNFALTGIRIFGQGGDNFSGTFRLYGISNS